MVSGHHFPLYVIDVVMGAIGIIALLVGIMLAGIGFILVKD